MTAPARQLSDANVGGTGLGQSASDLISFHGVTPTAQAAFVNSTGAYGSNIIVASLSGFVFSSSSAAAQVLTLLEAVRVLLIEKGLMASS